MTFKPHTYTPRLTLIVAMAAAGCGKLPPPAPPAQPATAPPSITIAAPVEAKVKAIMTITAGADTNPDATGRPSPVVVRVYQLKTDASFNGADFFALFDDDQKVLGAELISRDEFVLTPAERQHHRRHRLRSRLGSSARWQPIAISGIRNGAAATPPRALVST